MTNREKFLKAYDDIPTYRYHVLTEEDIVTHKTNSFYSAVICAKKYRQIVYDADRDFYVYNGLSDKLLL